MATLSGNKIKDTYQSLIKLTDNGNLTTGAKRITDGFGNNSPLFLSTTQIGVGVTPTVQFHASGDGKFGGNLTVTGNLVVEGSLTTVGTDTLTVKDPLIVLANNNTSSDAVDIGFYGKYHPSGTTLFAGLFRDESDDKFKLFKSLQVEPTTTVNTSGTGYTAAGLVIGGLEATTGSFTGNIEATSYIQSNNNFLTKGTLKFSNNADSSFLNAFRRVSGADTLELLNISNINTSEGSDVTFGGHISLLDNKEIKLGTDIDFKIYHNNTDAYIQNFTGDLIIENNANDKDIFFRSDDGSGGTALYFQIDGSAELNKFIKNSKHPDDIRAIFGDSNDLQIYHSSGNTFLQNSTGSLVIEQASGAIALRPKTGENGVLIIQDGAVELYHDNSKKLETTSTGISVTGGGSFTGDVTFSEQVIIAQDDASDRILFTRSGHDSYALALLGAQGLGIYNVTDNLTEMQFNGNGNVTFAGDITVNGGDIVLGGTGRIQGIDTVSASTDAANKAYVDAQVATADTLSEVLTNGNTTGGNNIVFGDSATIGTDDTLIFGAGNDLRIAHNGTDSVIRNFTGGLYIDQEVDDGDIIFRSDDGSGGKTAYFTIDGSFEKTVFAKDIFLNDSVKTIFGNSSDLQIYHDGSNSYIQNETGNLTIFNKADDKDIIFASDNGSGGTADYIRLDGSTGITQFDKDTKHNDSIKATFGGGSDLQIYHDGSNSYINETGTGSLIVQASDLFLRAGGTNNTNNALVAYNAGNVVLYHASSAKLETLSTGISVTGNGAFSGSVTSGASITASGNSNSFGNTTIAALSATSGTFSASVTAAGNSNSFGGTTFSGDITIGGKTYPKLNLTDNQGVARNFSVGTNNETFTVRNETGSADVLTITGADNATNFAGEVNVQGSTHSTFRVKSGNNDNILFAQAIQSDNARVGTQTNTPLSFFTNSAERVRVTTSGLVGIGTTLPASDLHILGTSNDTVSQANANLNVEGAGGNGMVVGTIASAPYSTYIQSGFVDNFSTAVYPLALNPLGANVGIGTTSPSQILHLEKADDPMLLITRGSSNRALLGDTGSNNGGDLLLYNSSGTNTVRIRAGEVSYLNGGSVGIGTTSPAQKVEVVNSGFAYIRLRSTASSFTGFDIGQHTGGGIFLNNRDNTAITLMTNNTTAQTIDNSQNSTFAGYVQAPFFTSDGGRGFKQDSVAFVSTYSNGNDANAANDIGSTSNKWRDAYFSGQVNCATISTTGNVTALKLISTDGVLDLDDNGNADGIINARASLTLNIDSDNNSTGEVFRINSNTTNANTNNLFNITETGLATFSGDVTLDNSGSGDRTLTISTTTGGDPTIVFNSDAANRSGLIKYQDNGTNIGRIEYVHNGDRIGLQAGSATGETMSIKNGAVGIGTTSPASSLEIYGGGNTLRMDSAGNTSKTFLMRNVNTATAEIKTDGNLDINIEDANRTMRFLNGDTERMRIDSSGNVLLTSDGDATQLQIKRATANQDNGLQLQDQNGNKHAIFNLEGSVTNNLQIASSQQILFHTSSDCANPPTSERMRITAQGIVGIGTSSPNAGVKLEVNGIISANGDQSPTGGGLGWGDYQTGGYKWIQSFESQQLRINPLGNDVFFPASSVGIGITSATAGSALTLNSSGSTGMTMISQNVNGECFINFADADDTNPGQIFYGHQDNKMVFRVNDTNHLQINSSGQLSLNGSGQTLNMNIPGSFRQQLELSGGLSNEFNFNNSSNTGTDIISFSDPDADAVGKISYSHNTNTMSLHTNSSERITIKSGGNVAVNDTSAYGRFSVKGSITCGFAGADDDITVTETGDDVSLGNSSGSIEVNQHLQGTTTNNCTLTFTYAATSWKSWILDYEFASTDGMVKGVVGGYNNNSTGHSKTKILEGFPTTVAVTNSGQNVIVTFTFSSGMGIHPFVHFKYKQGGNDGMPRADRVTVAYVDGS